MGKVIVEKRGRIVIPAEIRKALGIREGSELIVEIENGRMVLTPVRKITIRDLFGIAGEEVVSLEEVENALSDEA
ncbi:MAG: AbrB family transcriptional regulator [Candidatus Terraquivivens tikiterensis]|uniref:AbrB family transcriptional regulator n=1 Tax=Candidatus Terraquivivens tikiterensis TaxID=1980982 RepID=A0A2R7Y9T2_9ARCH|nr:MAG: AbrB family transcriptional regulator [Candidatus Terraquivivens tikiterensis]